MTISTLNNSLIVAATGYTSTFAFNFVGNETSDIVASSIASNGVITAYPTTAYTTVINPATSNQLWGIGGSVTFTSAPSLGTSILIQRILPYTQETSVQNQGNYFAQVTEQALDVLCMEIQQLTTRTTQFRGVWATATSYAYGDIVQDGANGNGTGNYYICQIANTSGVWATDLANGDWAISVIAAVPTGNVTLTGAVTGSSALGSPTATTLAQMAAKTVLGNSSATSGAAVGLTAGYGIAYGAGTIGVGLTSFASSLLGNVSLSSTGNYFDGPTVSQGGTGTWFACGTVTLQDNIGAASIKAKLWDGTNIFSSAQQYIASGQVSSLSLSGVAINPAGNIRISVEDVSSVSGVILANSSGNSKDSTILAVRIL